jgi:hypothetical protein
MGQTQGLKPHPAAFVPTLQGRSVRQAVCYNSGMDPLHATIEEFAAEGFTHVACYCPRCRMMRLTN